MQSDTQKQTLAAFGRAFALLLNRGLMYQATHPFVQQTIVDVCKLAEPLLEASSPLVYILNRGRFYIDEEILDPRINVARTAALFTNSGLQSVSFEKGLRERELAIFTELFASLNQMSTIESVKERLTRKGVFSIKVNHVVFKKVTEDDQIVSRDALKKVTPLLDSDDQQHRKGFMEALLESVLTEEFAKTLNIKNLMADPKGFTQRMIEADLAGAMPCQDEPYSGALDRPVQGRTGTWVIPPGMQDGASALADVYTGRSDALPKDLSNGAQRSSGSGGDGADPRPDEPGERADANPAESMQACADAGRQRPDPGSAGHPDRPAERQGAAAGPESLKTHTAAPSASPGTLLLHHIEVVQQEVEKHLQGNGETRLSDLAQSILEMKKQLLESIQSQKALGIAYANEAAIVNAAHKLTDKVLLELIKEEYQAGAITHQRLAYLILRLIPQADELKRLLPQIKRTLLQEGMAQADYLKLIHALQGELQSDELARVLQESSEAIGLNGDMLIDEVKRNPAHAAELIYLASEIRRGGGDETALSDILVEYVERIGHIMATDACGVEGGELHLKKVMSDVESTILKKLSGMNINTNLLKHMEERLNERMESILDNMRLQWIQNHTGSGSPEKVEPLSVLETLEHNVGSDEELSDILKNVRTKAEAGEIEENNFSQIHEEITRLMNAKKSEQTIPEGVLNSDEFMFILEKEIARCKRYGFPFSALALAFVTAKPKSKSLETTITPQSVLEAALEKVSTIFREVDYIGRIGTTKMLALLPMATLDESKKALTRVLRLLHTTSLDVRGVPLQLRVAGIAAAYDAELMPDAKAFVRHLSQELSNMVARIKSIQVLF